MAGLQKQLLTIPVAHGVDTKTVDQLVLPGRLVVCKNGRFEQIGVIVKRTGYSAIRNEFSQFNSSPGTILAGNALGVYDDDRNSQLLMFVSGTAYSYAPTLSKWVDRGPAASVNVQTSTVLQNSYEQTAHDEETLNGVTVHAYQDNRGGIRAHVVSSETGAVFQNDVLVDANGTDPRVVSIGQFLFAFYRKNQDLRFVRVNPYDPLSFDAQGATVSNLRSWHPFWDIKRIDNVLGSNAILVYATDYVQLSADYLTRVCYVTPRGTVGNIGDSLPVPNDVALEPTRGGLGLAVEPKNQDRFAIAYWMESIDELPTGGVMLTAVFSSSLQLGVTANTVNTIDTNTAELTGTVRNIAVGWQGSGSYRVAYTILPETSSSSDAYVKIGGLDGTIQTDPTTSLDIVSTGTLFMKSVGLVSNGMTYGTSSFFVMGHESQNDQSFYLLAKDDRKLYARSLPLVAGVTLTGVLDPSGSVLPGIQNTKLGTYVWPSSIRGYLQSASGSLYTLKGVSETTFQLDEPSSCYSQAQLGKELLVGGGLPSCYDGASFTEHGFVYGPEPVTFTSSSGGSVSTPLGSDSYLYSSLYRWTDARGKQHFSPITENVVHLGLTFNAVTASVPTLRVTNKPDAVIELYRSQLNGQILTRVARVANDKTVDRVSIIDVTSDVSIQANERIYTDGGVLESFAPEACTIVARTKNRVFLAGIESNPFLIRYSQYRTDRDGLEFNPDLQLTCDPYGGPITALADMDDKIVVFKEQAVFEIVGDGPTDAGTQDNFSQPQLVTTDVGCVDQRSVVVYPDGLLFKSSKGYYALSRGLAVSYIGAPVEAFNSSTCVAATLVQDKNEVRFLTDDGNCLVFNYWSGDWSTWTNHRFGVDALVYDGKYTYLRSDGLARVEDQSSHTDVGARIGLDMTTAWIKPGDVLQGHMRIWNVHFLGKFKSPHSLNVQVGYDYDESWAQMTSFVPSASGALSQDFWGNDSVWGSGSVWGGDADGVYQFRLQPSRQQCQSIRFRISDEGTPGEAFSLSSIQLECGIEPGAAKLRDGKTVAGSTNASTGQGGGNNGGPQGF